MDCVYTRMPSSFFLASLYVSKVEMVARLNTFGVDSRGISKMRKTCMYNIGANMEMETKNSFSRFEL